MKKVTFAILTVGVALFASCGGNNNAETEQKLKDSLALDSAAKATEAAATAAADSLAAAAAAAAPIVDSASKLVTPASAPAAH